MPGERVNGGKKSVNKRAKHAMVVNDKIVKAALAGELDEESMTYGIITKSLGHGRMRVLMADKRESTALIRKTLRQKRATGMGIGDIVILHCPYWEKDKESATKEPESYIEGLVDLGSAEVMRNNGILPDWMGVSAGTNVVATNEVVMGGFEFVRTAPTASEAAEEAAEAADETTDEEEEDEEEESKEEEKPAEKPVDKPKPKKPEEDDVFDFFG